MEFNPTLSNIVADMSAEKLDNQIQTLNQLTRPEYRGSRDVPDFTDKYNTELTPQEEVAFQNWMKSEGKSPRELADYDVRGAWKELMAGTIAPDERGHLTDKYKKPNHPTFSDGSIYHGVDGYQGGQWIEMPNGQFVFNVGSTNMYSKQDLADYFARAEKGVATVNDGREGFSELYRNYLASRR